MLLLFCWFRINNSSKREEQELPEVIDNDIQQPSSTNEGIICIT